MAIGGGRSRAHARLPRLGRDRRRCPPDDPVSAHPVATPDPVRLLDVAARTQPGPARRAGDRCSHGARAPPRTAGSSQPPWQRLVLDRYQHTFLVPRRGRGRRTRARLGPPSPDRPVATVTLPTPVRAAAALARRSTPGGAPRRQPRGGQLLPPVGTRRGDPHAAGQRGRPASGARGHVAGRWRSSAVPGTPRCCCSTAGTLADPSARSRPGTRSAASRSRTPPGWSPRRWTAGRRSSGGWPPAREVARFRQGADRLWSTAFASDDATLYVLGRRRDPGLGPQRLDGRDPARRRRPGGLHREQPAPSSSPTTTRGRGSRRRAAGRGAT